MHQHVNAMTRLAGTVHVAPNKIRRMPRRICPVLGVCLEIDKVTLRFITKRSGQFQLGGTKSSCAHHTRIAAYARVDPARYQLGTFVLVLADLITIASFVDRRVWYVEERAVV